MPIYSATGAINVVTNDTTKGRYSPTGALRVNLVSGNSYTGLYATDGALNVVDVTGSSINTYTGLYHPCGALKGRVPDTTFSGLYAPDGSYYLNNLFSPISLFLNNEVGCWYDPSDFSTMFQDSAGTIPVIAVDDPVGLIQDKSGRGNHALQATSGNRPVLKQDSSSQYYLLFDGVNSSLSTASINFTGTDEMTWFLGTRRLGTTATQMIIELSAASGSTNGTFALVASSIYSFATRGTTERYANSGVYTNPITHVLTGMSDISADNMILRVNGSQVAQTTLDLGTGNFSNNSLFIGARNNASLRYNGRLYSLIVRNKTTAATTIAAAETWINQRTTAF